MKLEEYFSKKEIELAKKVLYPFYDKLLLNDKINNPEAVLLVIYMCSNKRKKSGNSYKECIDLFCQLGRKKEEFQKALYELYKRKGNKKYINTIGKREKSILSLNFSGITKVKNIFNKDEKSNQSNR